MEAEERERDLLRKEMEEEKRSRERRMREERERERRRKVLIVKRGAKTNRKGVLDNKIIKIVRAASNKDAAKVFFASDEEKDEVWEKKEYLRREDMVVDRWLTIEERKERFTMMESTSSMKEEYMKKGFKLITKMEER